MGKTGKIRTLD